MAVSPMQGHGVVHATVVGKDADHVTTCQFIRGLLEKLDELDAKDAEKDTDTDPLPWMLIMDNDKQVRR